MERTMISWNLPNWITVLVMAAGGYAALGLIVQLLKSQGYGAGNAASEAGGF